jgi:pimeloyl-ACP methyl ester carboxylesterase
VLLHAGIADSSTWDEQVAAFAARYRVIRFDAQGFGRSPVAVEPKTRAQDVFDLLHVLGVGKAHVLGLSMGGGPAVDFASALIRSWFDRRTMSGCTSCAPTRE